MSVDLTKGKFDITEFNTSFEKQKQLQKEEEHKAEAGRLNKMNKEIYRKKISEMSLNELMSEWKNSLIGILNDLLNLRWSFGTLFAENRLFFLGITIVFCVLLFYIFHWIFDWKVEEKKIINEYHITMK